MQYLLSQENFVKLETVEKLRDSRNFSLLTGV